MSPDPFPFATVSDLEARWPDMPPGSREHAATLLDDASQFMVDLVPSTVDARETTRRRIVCAVVRRSMEASQNAGMSQMNVNAGPFSFGGSPTNPHGDFYLTRNEKRALGDGQQAAFSLSVGGSEVVQHSPWCDLARAFGIGCSCG
jgi:hypothetical protein